MHVPSSPTSVTVCKTPNRGKVAPQELFSMFIHTRSLYQCFDQRALTGALSPGVHVFDAQGNRSTT